MTKTKKIIYWVATLWLSLGMVSTAVIQLTKGKEGPGAVNAMIQLGYPGYFLTIIGVWKILGVVAVLIPKFPLLKEWAYAGFFFMMSGAIVSHVSSGSATIEIFPALLLLTLTVVSWYLRPVDRRITMVNQ
jgi:uncharacterized membrane protein YphA (DoxX/SURF4 family)